MNLWRCLIIELMILQLRRGAKKLQLRYIPYIALQCSWGMIQTLVGFLFFCSSITNRHICFNGSIATFWNKPYGISLGLFIFIPPKARFYNSEKHQLSDVEIQERLLVHEFGHTFQSLLLGPLYFLIIGLPSVIWGMVKKENQSYFSFYTESWANYLGEKHTGKKSMERIDI